MRARRRTDGRDADLDEPAAGPRAVTEAERRACKCRGRKPETDRPAQALAKRPAADRGDDDDWGQHLEDDDVAIDREDCEPQHIARNAEDDENSQRVVVGQRLLARAPQSQGSALFYRRRLPLDTILIGGAP